MPTCQEYGWGCRDGAGGQEKEGREKVWREKKKGVVAGGRVGERGRRRKTRGPLVLYHSPECWGYAKLEQTWKYKSTQCSISCHQYRSIRNKSDPVIKMVTVKPGSSLEKRPRAWAYNHLVQVLAAFYSFYYSHHFVPVPEKSLLPYYFISCMYIKPQGKRRQPLGTLFWSPVVRFKK